MMTLMVWISLAVLWLLVLPVVAVGLAKVLGFGERPSTPWDAWDVEASGAPRSAAAAAESFAGR